ncbi:MULTISPECIES: transcriptional regulator SpxA [Priestia]|jgi:regulatory protein spx|uniref:transcriptional regulator SpxA n=1 Tax=Priestia TaxID=2800373 RepID=UPI0011A10735|nr:MULTISPECIES: transcriptional regulator SpxA [Priestia]MBK0009627.1 transcriptional regulator Spx [Bacillus sp. S35]MBU8756932.1 transcriptional regulator SpxA [Priestia megaterium]MBZ6488455.1 transcriptional regulator Spx [Priestia aryabhattai]MDH3130168.1 transcriptional regulator SpxA [Priestia aryabhattai]
MINLYMTTSCTSCRKAKSWFEKNGIDYIERNISKDPLTVDEIKSILRMTEGTDEIISARSKIFKELNIDLDALPLQELYKLLRNHPTMIKRPIIQDEKKLQVGYQEEEIRAFIPRRLRAFTSRKSAVGE